MSLTVGLAGITGKFGVLLAAALLKNPAVSLRGYARNLGRVPQSLTSSRLTLYQGEAFDNKSIKTFVSGCDVVVCTYLGDDELMLEGQKILIDACEEAGVGRYFSSDWTLNYTKLRLGDLFMKDAVIHAKAHVETKKVVKGVHVMTGGFMEFVLSPFFQVWDPTSRTLRYWGDGTESLEATSYANAADFTASLIVDPTAVGVQKYLGSRESTKQLAEIFNKVYGFQPKLERLGSLDDLKDKMLDMRSKNPTDVLSYMPLYVYYYWVSGKAAVNPEGNGGNDLPVEQETWEKWLSKRTREEFLAL